jgi:MFS family permease
MSGPLAHRPFRLLAAGRAIDVLGNAMAPIALAFAVLDIGGSVSALGLVVAARYATMLVFLVLGGVVADRLPRFAVLVGSNALSALSQGAVAGLVLSGSATVAWLAVLAAFNGLVSAFAQPATYAIIPQTVPVHLQRRANAVLGLGTNSAMIAGTSLGGILVAAVGPGWALAVDAASFALAGACFAFVRVEGALRAPESRSVLRELREGWTEFRSRTWVWAVVAGFAFVNAASLGSIQILGPAVADDTVGRRVWGFVLAAQAIGYVAGSLVALRIRLRRLLVFGVACVALEASVPFALATAPVTGLLIAAAFASGIGGEQFGVAWETSLQEHVPTDRLARVYSYDSIGSYAAIPFVQILLGPIAAATGTDVALIGCATVIWVAVAAMLVTPSVRGLEHAGELVAT